MTRLARSIRGLAAVLSITLFAGAAPADARSPDQKLDALAGELASAIRQNLAAPPSKHHEVKILVLDFAEANGDMTRLGLQLPDELAEALRNRVPGLKSLDRSELRDLVDRERLDPAAFQTDAVAHWAAKTLQANLAIVGSIDAGEGGIELNVRVIGRDSRKRVAEATAH